MQLPDYQNRQMQIREIPHYMIKQLYNVQQLPHVFLPETLHSLLSTVEYIFISPNTRNFQVTVQEQNRSTAEEKCLKDNSSKEKFVLE